MNKELLTIKHEMDEEPHLMTLDDAFKEALGLSEGLDSEKGREDTAVLKLVNEFPDMVNSFTTAYKEAVLKAWNYEILSGRTPLL